MRERLRDRCKGRWRDILLGSGFRAADLTGKHGPCPTCGGKDRFRFDDKDGHGTWICSHCGAGDGIALVMRVGGYDFREAAAHIEGVLPDARETPIKAAPDAEKQRAALNRLWGESRPIERNSTADAYLRSRGVGMEEYPHALRCHRLCRYDATRTFPALIAMVRDANGKPGGLHRTFLARSGGKADVDAPRKMMPLSLIHI